MNWNEYFPRPMSVPPMPPKYAVKISNPNIGAYSLIDQLIYEMGLEYQILFKSLKVKGLYSYLTPPKSDLQNWGLIVYVWSKDKDKLGFFKHLIKEYRDNQKLLEGLVKDEI